MNCKVCERVAEDNGFCCFHALAYRNIIEKYAVWQKATGIGWIDYLFQIQKNSLTGRWAKEVATRIIEDEHRHVEEIK